MQDFESQIESKVFVTFCVADTIPLLLTTPTPNTMDLLQQYNTKLKSVPLADVADPESKSQKVYLATDDNEEDEEVQVGFERTKKITRESFA